MTALVLRVLGVLMLFAGAAGLVIAFGDARYNKGVLNERAAWTAIYQHAQLNVAHAEAQLAQVRGERDRAIAERNQARHDAVAATQQEITHAPDLTAAYAAYVHLRDSMRDNSAASRSRAWSDLSASIGAAPSSGAGVRIDDDPSSLAAAGSGCDPDQLFSLGRCIGAGQWTS